MQEVSVVKGDAAEELGREETERGVFKTYVYESHT